MSDFDKNPIKKDWELEGDFYKEDASIPSMSLEDFIDDNDLEGNFGSAPTVIDELKQAAEVITQVLKLAGEGKKVEDIAGEMCLQEDYVRQIQICAQSFPEDNAMAIARLLVMG